MVKRCQEAGSLNRPCSGSRLRGCDLRRRANNCFDSKLFCSIIPIPTNPEKLQIVRNLSTKRGGDDSDLFMQLRNFDNIEIYMN